MGKFQVSMTLKTQFKQFLIFIGKNLESLLVIIVLL